ncbi:UNVERIFIED_CONTAM: hypothetical protein B566_EDAN018022 [Ephemera danica]|nr:hypothetical protein B566_EDAN018022 [Ephemera danica]
MDKEDIITEAAAEPETEEDGPWNEYNIVEGLKSTLNSGFMSDLTVTVQEETFQCHAYILGMASPKLAKMIKTNPRELQLPDVLPSNFRSLLE